MEKRTCTEPGCDRSAVGRGLCDTHYRQAMRGGNPPPLIERRHTIDTLMALVEKTDGCWIWQGCISNQGYGRIHRYKVHRRIYELLVGPIPDGLSLDHECHNTDPDCLGGVTCMHRRCVRPDHLVPRPAGENARRSPTSRASQLAARTHCPHGHEYTDENTYQYGGSRKCRQCTLIKRRNDYQQRKARDESPRPLHGV